MRDHRTTDAADFSSDPGSLSMAMSLGLGFIGLTPKPSKTYFLMLHSI